MFAFRVEYLLHRVFAAEYGDRTRPEWPPHPGRLFSAMAAAYFEAGADSDAERTALIWLERQPPPLLHAPDAGRPESITTAFVPTNYPNDTVPVLRGKQPRQFPAQSPDDAVVHFIWPESQPDSAILTGLIHLSERVACLGRACSLVQMQVVDSAPDANYVPDVAGGRILRVTSGGRLEELSQSYRLNRRPSPGAFQGYTFVGEDRSDDQPVESEFGNMIVFRRSGGPGLPIEATLTLTDAVRAALQANVEDGDPGAELIHGHNQAPHCALISLPFVDYKQADGHLMGFAVVLPSNVKASERRTILRACFALAEAGLTIAKVGRWDLELEDAYAEWNLKAAAWTRPSHDWATVTPILLDRFPKQRGPTVEEIIGKACLRIGLPLPVVVEHNPWPQISGSVPVPQFRLRRKSDERPRWGVHATLRFDVPVRGPVLLGAGRYFGLGLLRPIKSQEGKADESS